MPSKSAGILNDNTFSRLLRILCFLYFFNKSELFRKQRKDKLPSEKQRNQSIKIKEEF
jgi:hypothetical protein